MVQPDPAPVPGQCGGGRLSWVFAEEKVEAGESLQEINILPLPHDLAKSWIFVTLFPCDVCFLILVIYMFFMGDCGIIHLATLEHLASPAVKPRLW